MATVTVASFNVENLFARPRAFDPLDWDAGKPALAAYAEFNDLITGPAYSDADRIGCGTCCSPWACSTAIPTARSAAGPPPRRRSGRGCGPTAAPSTGSPRTRRRMCRDLVDLQEKLLNVGRATVVAASVVLVARRSDALAAAGALVLDDVQPLLSELGEVVQHAFQHLGGRGLASSAARATTRSGLRNR